jgi:hypothetical protein
VGFFVYRRSILTSPQVLDSIASERRLARLHLRCSSGCHMWEHQLQNHLALLRYKIDQLEQDAASNGSGTQKRLLDIQAKALLKALEQYQSAFELEKVVEYES